MGMDDFGLFGVVGSVVLMFYALRYVFTDSVQRYINVAKGKGRPEEVSEIFSTGINVHILLSIAFIIIVEIGGLIILPHLNIGNVPIWEVQTLFQLSLFTAVVSLLTIPFDALIIANEKFNAYAVFSIIDVSLRFLAVILLATVPEWRVIWYSIFLFIVAIIVRYVNAIYCKRTFKNEAIYKRNTRSELLIEMSKFAGWNFLGNIGYWLVYSGTDFILNHFGGLVVNAARSITNQVFSNFQQFVGDLNTSFRPRSMQLFSEGKMSEFYTLFFLNTKVNFIICSVLTFAFSAFANPILKLWLGDVPPYTAIFCQTILLYSVIRSLRGPVDIFFKVNGDLKLYQIVECSITLLNLPLGWLALHLGAPLYSIFVIMALLEIINFISILSIATYKFRFDGKLYIIVVGYRILILIPILTILYHKLHRFIDNSSSLLYNVTLFSITVIVLVVFEMYIMFTRNERKRILSLFIKN
ncbi:MAG: MATE family efflux transporter [Muribaculaceae bacterium]|nr:MATE family efflux transporter [Muribaculaceae bacterium]